MIVVVGERANGVETHKRAHCLATRMSCGAFRFGGSLSRLEKVGLAWHAALNLLPAAPIAEASWTQRDHEEAARIVAELVLTTQHLEIIMMGERVSRAFAIEYRPFRLTFRGPHRVVCFPHPGGKNYWWRDPDNVEEATSWCEALRGRHGIARHRGLIPQGAAK